MPVTGMMGGGMMERMPMMGMMADAPYLNGQHAAYIVDQLDRFASGARPSSTMMGRIAAALSEADKRAVAEYLSGLR
jgi:cytochrome c553